MRIKQATHRLLLLQLHKHIVCAVPTCLDVIDELDVLELGDYE